MNQQTSSTEPTAIPHDFQKSPSTPPPAVSSESSSETSPRVTVDPKPATRCAHLFPSGRRCRRKPFDATSRFCPRHAKLPENLQPDDLTSELTANPGDLDTFDGLHSFLEDLLILLARNRITTRRAAVLAYITNQLIRTLTAAHKENGPESTPVMMWDTPRPTRD
jgi:hypothetical protein